MQGNFVCITEESRLCLLFISAPQKGKPSERRVQSTKDSRQHGFAFCILHWWTANIHSTVPKRPTQSSSTQKLPNKSMLQQPSPSWSRSSWSAVCINNPTRGANWRLGRHALHSQCSLVGACPGDPGLLNKDAQGAFVRAHHRETPPHRTKLRRQRTAVQRHHAPRPSSCHPCHLAPSNPPCSPGACSLSPLVFFSGSRRFSVCSVFGSAYTNP